MNTFTKTREEARAIRKSFNSVAPAQLKAPAKNDVGFWEFPGLSHKDGRGTMHLKH